MAQVARWRPYLDPYRVANDYPINHKAIWLMRDGWERPMLSSLGEHPMMNAVGLYWQPDVDGEGPTPWVEEKP